MELNVFNAFRDVADVNGILFYYNGGLSQNVIGTMGDALKKRLEAQDAKGSTSRKLYSTYIEMIQNALHYSPEGPDTNGEKLGAVAVGKLNEKYFIVCGNLVQKAFVARIREKLDPLKSMTQDEIKKSYREQLKNDTSGDTVSKGAGLGFLTVARDASEPIEYSLVETPGHEDELAYFYLKAII